MQPEKEQGGNSGNSNPLSGSDQLSQNPNPRANENIRVRSEESSTENTSIEEEVGSEITDGEDA